MARGRLRVYLGAAPGVGKTWDMLGEAHELAGAGRDVVVGVVETHGRSATAARAEGLEVVSSRQVAHRGACLHELDLDAVLARDPDVVLVDELAHTNAPGGRHQFRYQDVEELLAAGIDVLTTLNVQHLESLNDAVARITGVTQHETVPDGVVRAADQIDLVDLSQEALRNRLAAGLVYPPEPMDAALANYFRAGNLSALRELALSWTADRVDETLDAYRAAHDIDEPWETRERVVVAITGAPSGGDIVRRAARMAMRSRGELIGVHVASSDGPQPPATSSPLLEEQRRLLADCDGTYHEVAGADVAKALVAFARAENATQLVLGASRRSRVATVLHGSVINDVIRAAAPIDVHVIAPSSDDPSGPTRVRRPGRGRGVVSRRRLLLGWGISVVGIPLATLALLAVRVEVSLPSALLAYLTVVVASAATGGLLSSLAAAVGGFVLANALFTEPTGTLVVRDVQDVVALVMFVAVAVVIAVLVRRTLARTTEAVAARTDADALARAATALVGDPEPVTAMLAHVRATFDQDGVAVLVDQDGTWSAQASAGPDAPVDLATADVTISLGPRSRLALRGATLPDRQLDTLQAFAAQVASALDRQLLSAEAAQADQLSQANDLRTALLRAVSHDLKSPLASIKASVSSLRADDVTWDPEATDGFLASIEVETDRLITLITNLLDVSRLDADAVDATLRPVALEEVVATATSALPDGRVAIDVPETLPTAHADPALLERVVANLVGNAITHSPPDTRVTVSADLVGDRLHLRVIDHGPGIPIHRRDRVIEPFQRHGDGHGGGGRGSGLGLAVAAGMTRACRGELELSDTPGGGLTATVLLPLADGPSTVAATAPSTVDSVAAGGGGGHG